MNQEKKQCPVCYEDLTIKNAVNLPCNHTQCSKCFWKWTNEQGKQSCPMCRGEYLTHKNHHLPMEILEAETALEIAKMELASCLRQEDRVRLKVDNLLEEYKNQKNLLTGIEKLWTHKTNELVGLNSKYEKRKRECFNLGLYTREGRKMSDNMLSLFYERRHKKRLDIAQKKRDGRYKKVLEELRRYHYNLGLIDDDFKKIVLLGNQLKLVKFVNSFTDAEVNIRESSWMFEEDETNYGFWITQAQTTMKPVYADIRMNKSEPSWMISQNFMVWSPGNYERKIVNWLKPDDYAEPNWDRNELLYFRRWRKRLVKALRLTSDIKTEKGHRERNIDVVENRITRAYKTKNNIKINNENGLGDYGISMFDEPPAFAGAETRLSVGMWTEYGGPNHGNHRPILEEGEIDEIITSDDSMPELEEASEDEENIPATDHEANMMRLWRLDQDMRSGPITNEILERVATEVEFGLRHYTLQE